MDTVHVELIRQLVTAHKTNCQGHVAAIEKLPQLAQIADTGTSYMLEQIALCDQILEELDQAC